MTKKFWADWQKRIGETKDIKLSICVFNKNNGRCYYHSVLSQIYNDKILKASFHGDAGDLVIERHSWGNGHNVIENEYLTLHRNEIASIEFIKYYEI